MSFASGMVEPDLPPIDTDTILEGVIAVDSEESMDTSKREVEEMIVVRSAEDGVSSITTASAAPTGLVAGSELLSSADFDDGNTNSLEAGSNETRAPEVEEPPNCEEDGSQLQRSAPESTPVSEEESPSSTGNGLGENMLVLVTKSTASGGQCSVYLVGTAHVSQESCDEVQAVIRHVKPQVVFLELCASRVAMLMPQKLQVAAKLEVFPGSEFRVAYEEGIACGARVSLGDRPVQITLRRTWARMNGWHKTKLIVALIFQGFFMPSADELNQIVEDMKDTDMITAIIQEMSKSFPSLMDTLVHERDIYMAETLRSVAQDCSTVVAVIGKGHLRGISENWEKHISIESLLTVPQKKASWFSRPVVRWGAVAVAVGGLAIFAGVHFSRKS